MNTEQTITRAIDWLVANGERQPSLEEGAAYVGMEPTAFQKAFTARVGISPKRFVQVMTHQRARDLLASGDITTLEAAYDAGLSGNGRLHDLFVTVEAATPGEIRAKGAGMTIQYGYADSPFGELIAARTERGLCWLGFRVDDSRAQCLARIKATWPHATLVEDTASVLPYCEMVSVICSPIVIPAKAGIQLGERKLDPRFRGGDERGGGDKKLPLHLYGTNFQLQVWQALLKIPSRHFVSYQGIGASMGMSAGSQAIGNAVGANPVSLLIPCHRVIQKSGVLNNYGWGSARKKALLGVECA